MEQYMYIGCIPFALYGVFQFIMLMVELNRYVKEC